MVDWDDGDCYRNPAQWGSEQILGTTITRGTKAIGNAFGDLYIRINTQVPTSLTKKQKEILEEFNEIESNKPDPVIKSFFEKAKKFWRNS